MYNTLPDWLYNTRKYLKFKGEEFVAILVTSLFAAFILTFNDWGGDTFDATAGIVSLVTMGLFLFAVFIFTILLCKIIAVRLGYSLFYEPHLLGLMFGLVVTVASAGYLPLFLPGGFKFKQPERLYVGNWRGYHRTWHIPLVAGAFPMLLLAYVLLLSPVYILTGSVLVLGFIVALLLTAIYSLIPLPNVALEYGGRVLDFFRYLKGMTFGLEVYINSRTWYVALCTFVILFSIVAYLLTLFESRVAFSIYVIAFLLSLPAIFIYKKCFETMGAGFD